MKTEVLGIAFDNLTREQAAQRGAQLLQEPKFHYVATPNPEFILAAQRDRAFQDIINRADLVLPDGIGVVYCAKILGTPLRERVTGIEFAQDMLQALDAMGGRLFLLGAKPDIARRAGENIQKQYPNIIICGTQDGYFTNEEEVLLRVAAAQPTLLFVCLGAPKQEQWMARWGKHTGARMAIGLGGCLDVFSGETQRAPEQWQKLGLEWAYRLLKEPKRAARMARLPLVLMQAAVQRVKSGKGDAQG